MSTIWFFLFVSVFLDFFPSTLSPTTMASKNAQEQLIFTQSLLIETLREQVAAERSRADTAEQHTEVLRERIKKLRALHNGDPVDDDARDERRREKSAKQAAARAVAPSSPTFTATPPAPKDKKPRGPKKCKTCGEQYTAFKCPSVECAAKRAKQKEEDDAKKSAAAASSSSSSSSYDLSDSRTF